MLHLTGSRVVVRSLRAEDVDALVAGRDDEPIFAHRSADDVRARLYELLERDTELSDGFVQLAIEADGRLVGDIQARAPRYAYPPGVCEIGVTLFSDARGRHFGTEAVVLLTDHLLDEGWGRVQASTAVDNTAMLRVLERAGYAFEGVLRQFAPRGDEREDYAMYAATRPRR